MTSSVMLTLQCYVDEEMPDTIGIVKTWLNDKVSDAEVRIPG